MKRGQLSLEFLLLVAAFFSFLLLMLPAIRDVLQLGSLGVDVKAAELFAHRAKDASQRLLAFGEGSTEEIGALASHEWGLSSQGGRLMVEIGEGAQSKKLLQVEAAGLEVPDARVQGKFWLRL